MKSQEDGIRVYASHVNFSKIMDQPKSHRKRILAAFEDAKKAGYSEIYDDVLMLPVIGYSRRDTDEIMVIGTENKTLKPEASYEIICSRKGAEERWHFYFCIDVETKPEPIGFGMTPLSSGKVAATFSVPMPRRLYISRTPSGGRYQSTGFDMNHLYQADELFSKPRFIAIQEETKKLVVASVFGKHDMMNPGGALMSIDGDIYEVKKP
ncbi:MAG: hypothetical protein V1836_00100 [Candidatus Aenigmatarchaeota archaeon]